MVDLSANSTVKQDTAWDCCDVSKEAIETNQAYIYVNKELQRVTKEAVRELDAKDILLIFPEKSKMNTTVLVLKTPKTESSVRKVFLPRSVAEMLVEWKKAQEERKDILGSDTQITIWSWQEPLVILWEIP